MDNETTLQTEETLQSPTLQTEGDALQSAPQTFDANALSPEAIADLETKTAAPTEPVRTFRTVEEIQKEYNHVAFMAGDQQYQMLCMKENLDRINERLRYLNHEAAEASARTKSVEAEKVAAAEAKRARKATNTETGGRTYSEVNEDCPPEAAVN